MAAWDDGSAALAALALQGLDAAEFEDLHQSVMEALGFVMLDIQLVEANPDAPVDDLYGEHTGGVAPTRVYAALKASIRQRPTTEYLTRLGLKANADILAFIPRGIIQVWEAVTAPARTFAPREDMTLVYAGESYNVHQVRIDRLPVTDLGGSDYIGLVLTGTTTPSK